jgi:hypothetical protein
MASWVLVPCLRQLFTEFDQVAPRRAEESDGAVGDTAHSQTSSDHNPDETGNVPIRDADKINEVHAIDVTANLNSPDLTMERVVQFLVGRCRSGAEKRLRYIIFNRRVWSATSDWVQKAYTGSSPHTEHAHFSASYTSSLEASTASWHLADLLPEDLMLVKEGNQGELVKYWQYVLTDLGYDVGTVDGEYGPKMAAAVNAYRASYGLGPHTEITGWCARTLQNDNARRIARTS